MAWFQECTFYQIYPLGFCGAERDNDFKTLSHRLGLVEREIPRLKELGFGAVLFNPLFSSSRHGYDTADFRVVDNRLGDNADFKRVCDALHAADIRVVLDGVFNHVGREFFAFKDVREKREGSQYKDWFKINFGGNSAYNDGFWYEGWEGHYDLVKLNLENYEVQKYIYDSVRFWIDEFGIDGLRLDVGYLLPEWFLRELTRFCKEIRPDFFVVAEAIHGDYNRLLNAGVDSVTNYECYKGLHSAINSGNLFEIEHSLSRQFANTPWALYKGKHLMNFVDNHDVPRIYSVLNDKRDVPAAFAVLMVMPGIPCVYYGSEYGAEGQKGDCDEHLRPAMSEIDTKAHPEIYETVSRLIALKASRRSLKYGSYDKVVLNNKYFCIKREDGGERTLLAVNISDEPVNMNVGGGLTDLLSGESAGDNITVAPHSFVILGTN
ncbi:MAG: hypothetical protein HFK09_05745 [Clostridia bacterium]|nr:hypothetical protein [Clostridia bacterium]